MSKRLVWLLGSFASVGLIVPVQALQESTGDRGIAAQRLHQAPYNLIGRKIGLGQVEVGRPGKFGLDKTPSAALRSVVVTGVFLQDSPAKANSNLDSHASMVAMVMVSQDKALTGVAPGARLYSSAIGSLRHGGQPEECLSAQHIALQNGGDVRAINFSFGEPLRRDPRPDPILDGNALLTRCVDWSSRVHNTLYVVAGNQGSGGIPIPTDNFNGINVASSTPREDGFTKLDFSNLSDVPEGIGRSLILREINVGPRRSIGLVAPGSQITVYNLQGQAVPVMGTSFAAPHVVGTVALLQEFGDRQLASNAPQWTTDARRSEVMKAILLNSADKLKDPGDGRYLGMSRTLHTKENDTWLEGDAAQDPKIPLHMQIGTGHLNAYRAYQQFSPGQWSASAPVPPIGWDYGTVVVNRVQDYVLEKPLKEGTYAALTLAWHRLVELNDESNTGLFTVGDSFHDRGLNDLNLYLLPLDAQTTEESICSSVSEVDSVEHIFCPIPQTGRYKIRVEYRTQMNEPTQAYALAWWTATQK
ncbi:S8 family serine peptidase [Spirulina subsalsa FACHB-351]|uniref:S8 family serine peptidase n=1 Tax=Spirulina subsalsa FACHB-351 TaxID=234711 RepID=A0ABT3L8C3_9CYAN|nr:S8 family serine peptidase [Spirulina subsalsa]MCW6037768.1 S8 family serine peptidase [Spirulina subsalsa FACHB-351]